MNINATLVLQSIAMMIFVWFCMKFIWPPLMKAMDERREKIADGLAASDRAKQELAQAKRTSEEQIREARDKAGVIVEQANQRHSQILEQAKDDAVAEKRRQVAAAESEISLAANQAREELRASVASLAVLGASKILEKEIDAATHRELLDKLITEIE
jgi:F-type H+-transporting ATPase subunit b